MESVCQKCGATLAEGAPFCPECGAKTEEQTAVSQQPVTLSAPQAQKFSADAPDPATMKKVAIAAWCVALVALAAIAALFFGGGDKTAVNPRDEMNAIYLSHVVLAADAVEGKFSWHRYTSIFEELKDLRKKNQDLRIQAYRQDTAKMKDAEKQGMDKLKKTLDDFDYSLKAMLSMYEEADRSNEYSAAYQDRRKDYETAYSNYLTSRNEVQKYLFPESGK